MRMSGEQGLGGDSTRRIDDVVSVGEPSGGGRAAERRLVQRRRSVVDGITDLCPGHWSEWGLRCELEALHTGPHYGFSEDKVAYWGNGVAEWTRV